MNRKRREITLVAAIRRSFAIEIKLTGARSLAEATEAIPTEVLIMLWTILVVLLILWLLGLIGGVGGGLIHLLLVVALIVLLFQVLSGRRTVV